MCPDLVNLELVTYEDAEVLFIIPKPFTFLRKKLL